MSCSTEAKGISLWLNGSRSARNGSVALPHPGHRVVPGRLYTGAVGWPDDQMGVLLLALVHGPNVPGGQRRLRHLLTPQASVSQPGKERCEAALVLRRKESKSSKAGKSGEQHASEAAAQRQWRAPSCVRIG